MVEAFDALEHVYMFGNMCVMAMEKEQEQSDINRIPVLVLKLKIFFIDDETFVRSLSDARYFRDRSLSDESRLQDIDRATIKN